MATNCWEFKKCGRQPGGAKVGELGICPVATASATDGLNHGKNGGRACWAISGTLCGGKVQGTFAMKLSNCRACDFYGLVQREEAGAYVSASGLLKAISGGRAA